MHSTFRVFIPELCGLLGALWPTIPRFPKCAGWKNAPGEFVGVMTGEAYTLLPRLPRPTNPLRQRFGLEVQTQPVMRGICQIRQSLIRHGIEIADSANA